MDAIPDERAPRGRLSPGGLVFGALRDAVGAPPSEDAIAAVDELLPEGHEFVPYLRRFVVLMLLSSGIAAFGLLADSSAVVIGAMLIAPLMTPITAAAAATVMARNARLLRSVAIIVLGMVTAIAVGYATSAVAGTAIAVTDLPDEVRARTFPGLLDLGVAVTAGAAAGYIAPRRSALSALPGVGIAVALVPPLATVGITLEIGADDEAANAFLLFVTNLAAIVFSASIALILSGFHPRAGKGRRSLTSRLMLTLTAVVVVAIPLTIHTQMTVREASLSRSVAKSVVEWDHSVRVIELNAQIVGDQATVNLLVSGPNEPRAAWKLATAIQRRWNGPVDLNLLYQRDDLFAVSVR